MENQIYVIRYNNGCIMYLKDKICDEINITREGSYFDIGYRTTLRIAFKYNKLYYSVVGPPKSAYTSIVFNEEIPINDIMRNDLIAFANELISIEFNVKTPLSQASHELYHLLKNDISNKFHKMAEVLRQPVSKINTKSANK